MKHALQLPRTTSAFVGVLGLSAVLADSASAQVPYLTAATPPRNAATVGRSASVDLTFSQPMSTTTADRIQVYSARAGGAKFATYAATGPVVSVNPLVDFLPGETVTVTVPATVRSAAGTAATPHTYQFTTAVSPTGSGIFAPAALLPDVAISPKGSSAALGDLDGDGDLDLVVTHYDNQNPVSFRTLTVLFNSGLNTGNFVAAPASLALNPLTGNVGLGDVDGDGDLDLLVVNNSGTATNAVVNVRLNDGTGNFSTPTTNPNPAVGTYSWALTTGDLDGDGDLDLVTTGVNATNLMVGELTIRLNQGLNSGNFVAPATNGTISLAPSTAGMPVLGDVDGDGDLDILTAGGGVNSYAVQLNLNDGSGNFATQGAATTVGRTGSGGISSLALGDVDGDGDLDLLATCSFPGSNGRMTGAVYVRLNQGLHSGIFVAPATNAEVMAENVPGTMALSDVDGDGDLDAVVANPGYSPYGTTMSVRLNDGTGQFTAPATNADPAVGGNPRNMLLGDVDGDGDLDAVFLLSLVSNNQVTYQSAIAVRRNEPAVAFLTTVAPASGASGSAVTLQGADFTGATAVSFNGTLAPAGSFTVLSATTIRATVPAGAQSGPVYVTTPRGVLTTTTPFTVSLLGTTAATSAALLKLYPNPAHTVATVELPAVAGAAQATLTLLDALGRVVHTQREPLAAAGTTIAVPLVGLVPGLYHLRVQAGGQQLGQALAVE